MGFSYVLPILIGKTLRVLARLRGGGSAFPGYAALRLAPRFLHEVASQFEHGVVFVLGSNGKSTTTHMLSEVLRAHGVRVFTNPSGANLPQGIASSLLAEVSLTGRLKADIAVLEVDEAYALEFTKVLRPSTVLMLNTQVDQLYRFYETERVADMMLDTSARATEHIVTNREDPYLSKIARRIVGDQPDVTYFGASAEVIASSPHGLFNATDYRDGESSSEEHVALGELRGLEGASATVAVRDSEIEIVLPAKGLHYAIDAAAALATAAVVLGEGFVDSAAQRAFERMKPAYGRGELLQFGDEQVEFVMFKNAASLQLNLDALPEPPEQVLLAIDEGTPDISWIYDIDFSGLDHVDVITGAKAWQIALRLEHEGIPIGRVEPDLRRAIDIMRSLPKPSRGIKTWVVNYEQMMLARKLIGFGELENQR
ncbi:MurT ligase domain-containing protein [Salinibacterium sp. SYSU T00001]|uniref:MurT ligase domain-containing protein n=1 Tax=Homoserinimonas sedimenticola TaxID=2986805 RepID=UPI002235BEBB|nr:MurT ligase domain-containing protein [Salinibacterium sedimenticola]MCW4384510.1 MurT ligase domain-containing protein [Salinibacterium sedimenticola]